MAKTYRTKEGDTLADRYYGRYNGTTEATLEANRGIVAAPLVLPEGTALILPEIDDEDPIQTVKLYD